MDFGTWLWREARAVTLAWCAALMFAPLCAGAEDPGRIGITGNAAFHYWRAMAVMQDPLFHPESKEDIDTQDFLDLWPSLPPEMLCQEKPEVRSFLERYLERGAAMEALHQAASELECDFGIGPEILLVPNHDLSLMRWFARRACAVALIAEYDKDQVRAAQIYGDLLHFGAHLGQQPSLMYGLTGGAIAQMAEGHAVNFLLRKPGPEALQALLDSLQRIPQALFPFDRNVSGAAGFWAFAVRQYRLSDKELDENIEAIRSDLLGRNEIARKFGLIDNNEKILGYLRSLSVDQRKLEVERWAKEVETSLNRLAEASRGDFKDCIVKIKEQTERMKQSSEAFATAPAKGNPFAAPYDATGYVACVADVARINILRIICAAELYRNETGAYMERIEQLGKYFPEGLPKDPFTGEDFTYSMEEGFPAIRANPPKEYAGMLARFPLSLGEAGKQQARTVERYLKEKAEGQKKP